MVVKCIYGSKCMTLHSFFSHPSLCLVTKMNLLNQARNEKILRAGEVSENKDTLKNISSATYERKAPQGKISEI